MLRSLLSSPGTLLATMLACLVFNTPADGEDIPYRRAASSEEAVERIEELGGSVRYLTAEQERLEVDFQFAGAQLRDEHLKYLQLLENVDTLRLKQSSISDRGLFRLRKITTLRRLFLDETAITDNGLKYLATLPKLEFLSLYGTSVSDDGLQRLATVTTLKQLYIARSGVTEEGVATLQAALTDVRILPDRVADRQRAEAFLAAARKLLADAEQQLATAEKEFNELNPRKEELKKDQEATKKGADEAKAKADELKKQSAVAAQRVEEAKKQAQQAAQKASDNPDDEKLKAALKEKSAALAAAEKSAAEAAAAADQAKQEAEAAKAKADAANSLSARVGKVTEIHGQAQKVLAGARLRLQYAERELQQAN